MLGSARTAAVSRLPEVIRESGTGISGLLGKRKPWDESNPRRLLAIVIDWHCPSLTNSLRRMVLLLCMRARSAQLFERSVWIQPAARSAPRQCEVVLLALVGSHVGIPDSSDTRASYEVASGRARRNAALAWDCVRRGEAKCQKASVDGIVRRRARSGALDLTDNSLTTRTRIWSTSVNSASLPQGRLFSPTMTGQTTGMSLWHQRRRYPSTQKRVEGDAGHSMPDAGDRRRTRSRPSHTKVV